MCAQLVDHTDNTRIKQIRPLISPALLLDTLPISQQAAHLVYQKRQCAEAIIKGQDDRLLVITGPCSIHDVDAALAYAEHVAKWQTTYEKELVIIMRVYFEKPRTTVGWKGLINDPHLDNRFDINHGLHTARHLLLTLANQGIAAGTEFLDTIIPQYIADLITWGAIGARTTESQIHRELASGLSMPIGFKNGTQGDIDIAIDAIAASAHPHHFLSVTKQGVSAIVSTTGNDAAHMILRGSKNSTNYQAQALAQIQTQMEKAGIKNRFMIDCSHGNSQKDHERQIGVGLDIASQIKAGNQHIGGVMLESHLVAGKQTLTTQSDLRFGQSITDACMDITQTSEVLAALADAIKTRQKG